MSTTIDQRVVEMRFDNKQFESGVATTLSSISKLKESLRFKDSTKGLEDISTAARRVDMSPLGGAVDKVGLKFSAMYSIADQALRNITTSAMHAGKQIVSALTIDPIKMGFQEYETQINAIQTILANTESKGTTLDDVNGALDELNRYADKTIYNFTEMTRNIGTFTAAGVDLDTSVSAIKGIANLAAVSGSTSQQASTAMYQLSQALASGTVKLMDWNSVVNAGMGGQVFQDALKDTARIHGVAIDDLIEQEGSFRETLRHEWLTSEILTETLSKFTGDLTESQLKGMGYTEEQIKSIMKLGQTANDAATKVKTFSQLYDTLKEAAQSGWTQTWEIIVGDFEEAKELLTSISDTIGGMLNKSAESRNKLLGEWKTLGGRQDLIDSLYNVFNALLSVIQPVKDAFRDIFPPLVAEQLVGFTSGLKEFTSKLILGEKASNNLKRTFKGIFAVVKLAGNIFGAAIKAVGSLFGVVGDLGGGLLGVTAHIGDFLVKFTELISSGDIFNKIFQGVANVIKFVAKIAITLFNFLASKLVFPGLEVLHKILERIHERMSNVGEAAGDMMSGLGSSLEKSSFFKFMMAIWNVVKTVGTGIAKAFGILTSGLVDKIGNADFNGIFDFINTISFSAIAAFFAKFVKGFSDVVESVGSFKESVIGILDSVRGCFEAYQTKLKADALKGIAVSIAILTASLLVLSLIDSKKLSVAIAAISTLFAELLTSMKIVTKLNAGKGLVKLATSLAIIASALFILSLAMKIMSTMSWGEMGRGLISIATGMGVLVGAIRLLPEKKLNSTTKAIKKISNALVVLALAIKIMSTMSWKEMGVGLITMTVALASLVGAVHLLPEKKANNAASAIGKLSVALLILSGALKIMGSMSWKEMGIGLISMLGSLGLLVAAVNLLPKDAGLRALGILSFGAAMVILAGALKIMSTMSWKEMGVGLISMAGSLAALVLSVNLLPKDAGLRVLGIIAFATAMVILAGALKIMGSMSWGEVAKSLVTLGGSIVILAVGLNAMKTALPGAAAMVIAAAAIGVLTPALAILGAMSWSGIVKGLVAIAGAFLVIGVAGLVLQPLILTILGLGVAFTLIGVGALAFGAGLSAIAVGFSALVLAVSAGATAIVSALTVIVMGIVSLIPAIMIGVGEAIAAFCRVIIECAPLIGEALLALCLSAFSVLPESAPVLVEGIVVFLLKTLEILCDYIGPIIDALAGIIINCLDGLIKHIPTFVQKLVELFMITFASIIDALMGLDTSVITNAIAGIGMITVLILACSALTSIIPTAMVGLLALGAFVVELGLVLAAIGAIAQIPGLQWLIDEGGDFLQSIGTAIGKFVGGIIGGIAEGATSALPQVGTNLANFMTNLKPFIDGAKMIDASVMEGVNSLANVILKLTAANILDGLTRWITGGDSITKFALQLPILGAGIKGFATAVSGIVPEEVTAAARAAESLAEMTKHIPNEGGMVAWFTGENSISKFGSDLIALGNGIKGFSIAVTGINAESLTPSVNAVKCLVEMTKHIPNSGGVAAWFAGDNSVSKFASDLIKLGYGLKGYSTAVAGIVPEEITSSANAAKSLAEMTKYIPNSGGIKAWFTGDNSISKWAKKLPDLGAGLKGFSDSVAGISPVNITAASSAAKGIAEFLNVAPDNASYKAYEFVNALEILGEASVDGFVNAFKDCDPKMADAGRKAIEAFINAVKGSGETLAATGALVTASFALGVTMSQSNIKTAFSAAMKSAVKEIEAQYWSFYNAGVYICKGLKNGISDQSPSIASKVKAVMKAALEAAKKALGINSPSKEFYKIGDFGGQGFINALDDYSTTSYKAGSKMATSAREGLRYAMSKLNGVINGDISMQPTIRPVLDLSDVRSGARVIGSLFGSGSSVGVLANVGSINSMVNRQIQNRGNDTITSAIDALRKDLKDSDRATYNINGITYDDGSNVTEAVKTLIRAAKIERRV